MPTETHATQERCVSNLSKLKNMVGPSAREALACALVCDHKLSAPAGALAKRLTQLWMVDVHIFIERGIKTRAKVTEIKDVRITYHYEKLFETTLDILPDHPRFTRAAWGRLFVPEFLPLYDRLLYLDVDIIPGPLNNDFSCIDLPFGLGMVRDASYLGKKTMTVNRSDPTISTSQVELSDYFNSGVILFDPAKWNSDWLRAKLKQHSESGMLTSQYPDQDFINTVFEGKISELSANMNFQLPLMSLGLIASGTPSISHYTSAFKPFHALPKRGAPELVCDAAKEFEDMRVEAGLGDFAIVPNHKPKGIFVLKGLMRKFLEDRGISTRKSKELRHQWHERRRTAHRYLDAGVKDGVFLDKFDFVIDTSDISTRFNGFEIMPDT